MSFSYHNSNTNVPARRFTAIDGVGYGKVAIITGCSSGVGLATTQLFLSHQYEVLGVDINDIEYSEISENDQGRFHFHKADLTVPGECDEVVRISVGKFGYASRGMNSDLQITVCREKIDVLANVAGIMDNFEAADVISDAVWDRVIGVNLTVPIKMMRAVLPFMKAKKHGSIINVCSKASTSGAASGIAYTASKHGLVSFSSFEYDVNAELSKLGVTKHTAWRFKNEGIRCNAVTPGGTCCCFPL